MEIRVINFPKMKMVSSGSINGMKEFNDFDNWWSSIDMKNYISPRDFIQFNKKMNYMEWLFAIPENFMNESSYKIIDFEGGLYAVGTSKDSKDSSNEVRKEIYEWVDKSECFAISNEKNDASERYELSHVITPKIFKEKMGYHLSDTFIPIVIK